MIKLKLILIFTIALAATSTAQNIVTRDSLGAYRITQGRNRPVPLDTAIISTALKQKVQDQQVVQDEITLMEQILQRRRQLAAIIEDKRTLTDILEQARALKSKKP
jgi:hypothetical protein